MYYASERPISQQGSWLYLAINGKIHLEFGTPYRSLTVIAYPR